MLNEVSVVEVVVRSIRAVGQMEDDTFEGRHLLLEDLYELLNRVAVKALSSQQGTQVSELIVSAWWVPWLGKHEAIVLNPGNNTLFVFSTNKQFI